MKQILKQQVAYIIHAYCRGLDIHVFEFLIVELSRFLKTDV